MRPTINRSDHPLSSQRRHPRPGWLLLLAVLLSTLSGTTQLAAQQIDTNQFINQMPLPSLVDTAVPIRPIWGFNDDEFSIGGFFTNIPVAGDTNYLWGLARALGISIIEDRTPLYYYYHDTQYAAGDSLARYAVPRDGGGVWHERIILAGDPISRMGRGREVILYPFDSSQLHYWPAFFRTRRGGTLRRNPDPDMKDYKNDPLMEQQYSFADSTTANEVIAERMVIGYDTTVQTTRYGTGAGRGNAEVSGDAFWQQSNLDLSHMEDINKHQTTLYLVVTGHLFDPEVPNGGDSTVSGSDSLLLLEIWNEIPHGTTWRDASGALDTASADTAFLYKTIPVRKSVLLPGADSNYNKYRDTAYAVNMVRSGNLGGAYNDSNSAHRFDLRIRWTGAEKLALRSVALRDTLTNLLLTTDSSGIRYRAQIMQGADRLVYGPDTLHPDTSRFGSIIRLAGGDEPIFSMYSGYNWIDSTLYHRYGGGDAITRGLRAWEGTNNVAQLYTDDSTTRSVPQTWLSSSAQEINLETYSSLGWVPFGRAHWGMSGRPNYLPAIREHNGGRFFHADATDTTWIPELPIDTTSRARTRDSVEVATILWQRTNPGAYIPGRWRSPHGFGHANALGMAAWTSRRTGRRIIHWPGCGGQIGLRWHVDSTGKLERGADSNFILDVAVRRTVEASELRSVINLGLCYGSRGVHYPQIGNNKMDIGTTTYHYLQGGVTKDTVLGTWEDTPISAINGTFTSDTFNYQQSDSSFLFETADHAVQVSVPYLYLGWRTGSREAKWLNTVWLPLIGAEMLKLRWRDGYSIHLCDTQTYMPAKSMRIRPLPSTEIVTHVEAYDHYGVKDDAMNTFVELGFFDPHTDPSGRRELDTAFAFVLNRRCFERSSEIPATSARGRMMDSVAEVRRIRLTFNLHHPDTTLPNYIRIREVVPDTTRLPFTTAPRKGLDTIIVGTTTADIVLRPGSGALLEITYWMPGENTPGGDLTTNSQRKVVFTGNRYFATYFHPITLYNHPSTPHDEDAVFFRRSLPVVDTTRGIQWEPYEYRISDTADAAFQRENRFPSITFRVKGVDTVAEITWSSYGSTTRRIWYRAIRTSDTDAIQMSTIEPVGSFGSIWTSDTVWGTPTISSLAGGEMFAWSDPTSGILARFRRLGSGGTWWSSTGVYSDSTRFTWSYAQMFGAGRSPSMPPFAHRAALDSNIGIVYVQPIATNRLSIFYARLQHDTTSASGTLKDTIRARNFPTVISHSGDSINLHPSIDMAQDVWASVQEGVTWESIDLIPGTPLQKLQTSVHFSTLFTNTSRVADTAWPHNDSIGVTYQWTYNRCLAANVNKYWYTQPSFFFPSTSSLNGRNDTTRQYERIWFSIILGPDTNNTAPQPMRQAEIEYASHDPLIPIPYLVEGYNPNGSGSPLRQSHRLVALYQEQIAGSPIMLNTTRQFFAKIRPRGYTAIGRQLYLRINDSLATGITLRLHDVWTSDDVSSMPLAFVERTDACTQTDTLSQVATLMRTKYFHAHDSTTMGWQSYGHFVGDSASGAGVSVSGVTELIDSVGDRVVATLDSCRITAGETVHYIEMDTTLDLLSGTYYVRMRIDTSGLQVATAATDSRYPVEEVASSVEEEHLAKVRWVDTHAGANGRISAQPNPAGALTEVRFSIPVRCMPSVAVYDAHGREVVHPVAGVMMEAGRYAFDLATGLLVPGTYLVELRYNAHRVVEKIVVVR